MAVLAIAAFLSPAAQRVILFLWFAGPAVHAVPGKPDSMNVDYREHRDTEPDQDAGSPEIVRKDGGYDERRDYLQHAAPDRESRIEVPELDVSVH